MNKNVELENDVDVDDSFKTIIHSKCALFNYRRYQTVVIIEPTRMENN